MAQRSRKWAFTLPNWTEQDLTYMEINQNYKYLIYGFEIAPETKTPHLQGYVEYEHPITMVCS